MRLLSVACLSLAAKMDECHVPALSDFSTRKYNFENRLITRMELLILSTLDWKMSSITPFSYIQFFIDKLLPKTSDRKQLFSAANDLVFAASKEMNLVEYRPSTIAAAAVLASSSGQLTREVVETKMGFVSSCRSLVILGKQLEDKLFQNDMLQKYCLYSTAASDTAQEGGAEKQDK